MKAREYSKYKSGDDKKQRRGKERKKKGAI